LSNEIGAALEQRQLLQVAAMAMTPLVLRELLLLPVLGAVLVLTAMMMRLVPVVLLVLLVRLAPLMLPGTLGIPMRLLQPTLPVPHVIESLRMLLGMLLAPALLVPPELSMRLVLMPLPLPLTPPALLKVLMGLAMLPMWQEPMHAIAMSSYTRAKRKRSSRSSRRSWRSPAL
jgi:hypothetical protein